MRLLLRGTGKAVRAIVLCILFAIMQAKLLLLSGLYALDALFAVGDEWTTDPCHLLNFRDATLVLSCVVLNVHLRRMQCAGAPLWRAYRLILLRLVRLHDATICLLHALPLIRGGLEDALFEFLRASIGQDTFVNDSSPTRRSRWLW